MIKKLNKNRFSRERGLPDWYYNKETTDFTKINIHLYDIKYRLEELRSHLFLSELRLRNAITHEVSNKIKVELIFQERIVKGNLANIEKLQAENEKANRENYKREYGEELFEWD